MSDAHRLARFVDAQAGVYDDVLAELEAGRKRSHWMWFIFPQLRGLGRSGTAQHFGIGSLAEARSYAEHPLLGARLLECCRLLLAIEGGSAAAVLGPPDDMKLRSSMTLFAEAIPKEALFGRVLTQYFGGAADDATLALLTRL